MAFVARRASCPRPSLVLAEQQGGRACPRSVRGWASGLRGFSRLTEAAAGRCPRAWRGSGERPVPRMRAPGSKRRVMGLLRGATQMCARVALPSPAPGTLEPPPGLLRPPFPPFAALCGLVREESLVFLLTSHGTALVQFCCRAPAALRTRPRRGCGSQGFPTRRQRVLAASWEGVRKGRRGWSAPPDGPRP